MPQPPLTNRSDDPPTLVDAPTVIDTNAARGGRTTGIMRYVLGTSILLAAAVMLLAWLLGAFSV